VRRALSVLAAVLLVAGCGSSKQEGAAQATATKPTAPSSSVTEQSVCPSEQKAGILADFGHRQTTAAARELAARAERVGFKGLVVQRRGCNDFAVVLSGLRDMRQAREFRKEASQTGFPIEIDCRSHPVEGGLAAVFGHRPTRRAALQLQAEAEHVGFRDLRVQQDSCDDWEVDLYGMKTRAERREIADEARRAGFRIVFELG
jgi:cell division septation protein DedD